MSQESSKTFGDQAHLLRAIEHAITYDRQAAPRSIDMLPEHGSALIRFAEDDMAAVTAWAERTGATAVHGTTTYPDPNRPWHEFGTRPGGALGQLVGWSVDLWCVVNEPAPEPVVLDPAAGAELAAKVQAEVDAQPVEHQLDASWKDDGPGQCGVRCTCDTTFDGFDSLAEAVAELHKHIANPEPTDDEIADEIDQAFAEPSQPPVSVFGGRFRIESDGLVSVEPQDGHRYSCCGKVGRISRHESWCETNRAEIPSQRTGE